MSGVTKLGVVVLAVVLVTLVSTSAFSSVSAERTVDISVVGDDQAVVQLVPYENANGQQSQFANLVGGQLEIDINVESEVTAHTVFNITNHGTQSVAVWVTDIDSPDSGAGTDDNNTDMVTFYNPTYGGAASTENGKESIEGRENAVELGVGETLVVSIYIDTTNIDSNEVDILDELIIHADADVDGNSDENDGSSGGGGGSGSSGDANIHPATGNNQVTFQSGSTEVLKIGNKGDGTLTVSNLTITGPDAGDFEIVDGDAPFSLEPGPGNGAPPWHKITLKYTGNGKAEATLEIESNDPDESLLEIRLKASN